MSTSRTDKKQAIYEALLTGIVDLDYAPGSFLNEASLAERFEVSRTPVREVIKRLALEKYIEVIPHYGNRVVKIDLNRVRGFLEMRVLLETAVLKAVSEVFEEYAAPLYAILDDQKNAMDTGDLSAFWQSDNAFHETLFAIAEKAVWWEVLKSAQPHYMRYRKLDMTDINNNADLIFIHHKNILKAIAAKDEKSYQPLISGHVHLCLERMPVLLEKYPDYFVE